MSKAQHEPVRIERSQLGSTDRPSIETEIDDVRLPELVCPRDGTILEMYHKTGAGRFECPMCRQAHSIEEVFVDR